MPDLFNSSRPDGRGDWRVIDEHVTGLAYGAEVTFDNLSKLLGDDARPRIYRAVRSFNRHMTAGNVPRVLGSVRNVGYRVLRPDEYAPLALAYREQAARRVGTAVDVMRAAPLADMTAGQRDWAHRVTMVLLDNEWRLRSHESRLRSAEERLAELERRAGIVGGEVLQDSEQALLEARRDGYLPGTVGHAVTCGPSASMEARRD